MADTFRALCAELLRGLDENRHPEVRYPGHLRLVMASARAELAKADEPAVPEGREPVAVTEQPSDEELALIYHDCCGGCEFMDPGGFEDAARAVLAHWGNPAPLPPADGEVSDYADFAAWLAREMPAGTVIGDPLWWAPLIARRAAELLQRQALVPVSVSERPWEREGWCDVEGRFWAEHISRSGVASWRCAAASDLGGWAVRCLPAHALPLPEVGE